MGAGCRFIVVLAIGASVLVVAPAPASASGTPLSLKFTERDLFVLAGLGSAHLGAAMGVVDIVQRARGRRLSRALAVLEAVAGTGLVVAAVGLAACEDCDSEGTQPAGVAVVGLAGSALATSAMWTLTAPPPRPRPRRPAPLALEPEGGDPWWRRTRPGTTVGLGLSGASGGPGLRLAGTF